MFRSVLVLSVLGMGLASYSAFETTYGRAHIDAPLESSSRHSELAGATLVCGAALYSALRTRRRLI